MIFKLNKDKIIVLNIIMEIYILLEVQILNNITMYYLDIILKIKIGLNYKILILRDNNLNLY